METIQVKKKLFKLKFELRAGSMNKGKKDWHICLFPQFSFGYQNFSFCKAVDIGFVWLFWWVSFSFEK